MSRPELGRNPALGQTRLVAQIAASAIVQSASGTAAAIEAAQTSIDSAVAGDLIAASPTLATKLGEIETRLDDGGL